VTIIPDRRDQVEYLRKVDFAQLTAVDDRVSQAFSTPLPSPDEPFARPVEARA
jgi:hypothetical protein